MNKKAIFSCFILLVTMGCGQLAPPPAPTFLPARFPTWTFSPPQTPTEPVPYIPTLAYTQAATATPTATLSPIPTVTPTIEAWVYHKPGKQLVPILLYHQIGYSQIKDNAYYVSPEAFEQQMALLHTWGYETISVKLLALAILQGAELPPKPIIVTFDDGNDNTYNTAFPILQKYNFTGTAYIVYNYVGIPTYMDKTQIRELYAAGWEIGSHSLSHIDLTKNHDRAQTEIVNSRLKLQDLLGIPISSFAYPFGAYDDEALYHIPYAGYIAAVGLGADMNQGPGNLYYLYRREIKGAYDLKTFAQFLPWQGDLESLPTGVP